MTIKITGTFDLTISWEPDMGKPPEPPGHGGQPPPGHGGTPPGQQPEPPDPGRPTPPDRPGPVPPDPPIDVPPDIEEPPPDIELPPAGAMQAVVTLNGEQFIFDETDGEDLGDYLDPRGRFLMSCRRVTYDDSDLTVDFRRIDGWVCVVFDTGNPFNPTPLNLPAYEVEIIDDAGIAHPVTVPAHWCYARWRWQSGQWPLPLIPVTQLEEEGLIPRYDGALTNGTVGPLPLATYTPMETAGLNKRMPDTGGRADIGLFTGWQGDYLCNKSETALASVLAQGEAGGTFPWHFRDPATGAPLDLMNTWKQASLYWNDSANPYIQGAQDTGIEIDSAHQPALAYLPFALTGDPYFLETLQAQANFAFLENPRSTEWVWAMPGSAQTRSMGWNLRTIGAAVAVTPDEVPSWLLPKSVMRQMLDQCKAGTDAIMSEGGTNRTVLHCIDVGLPGFDNPTAGGVYPASCFNHPWQTSFFGQAVAWLAHLHPELEALAYYVCQNLIARVNGIDWDASYPAEYCLLLRPSYEAPWFTSWAECWAANAPLLLAPVAPLKNQMAVFGDYHGGVFGALAAMAQAYAKGVTIPHEIDAVLANYAGQMAALLGTGGNYLDWNNAIAKF